MRRMPVRVAVADRMPMYARGLAATLEDHGTAAETPGDLLEWIRPPGDILLFLGLSADAEWRTLAAVVAARPDASVVGVVAEPEVDAVVRAVGAGASGVMPRDASPDTVGAVLRAALGGQALLPGRVLRDLVGRPGAAVPGRRPISDDEIGWLRALAGGATVARLAGRVGYSERMMFRMLAGVYRRLGVENRTKALIRARDEGWL
jgi:DNA-binding NarL/FixJ family response regulator